MNPTMDDVSELVLERLIRGMGDDGLVISEIPLRVTADHPDWEQSVSPREWRHHVPPAVRAAWGSLSVVTRLCVYETAEMIARDAATGAVMLTAGRRGDYLP